MALIDLGADKFNPFFLEEIVRDIFVHTTRRQYRKLDETGFSGMTTPLFPLIAEQTYLVGWSAAKGNKRQ